MSLYDLAKIILFGIIVILGLVMVVSPKACTKKELRENVEEVSKIRKAGFFEMACGIILIIITVVF